MREADCSIQRRLTLACVHLSIFEHAEIDHRTEQSARCVGAEAPFNVWSVDAAHLPGELDCRPLFRPLSRRSRVRARFSRVHLAQKWAPKRTASGGFSFPPDDDEEFRGGRGERVNRSPRYPGPRFTAPDCEFARSRSLDGTALRISICTAIAQSASMNSTIRRR